MSRTKETTSPVTEKYYLACARCWAWWALHWKDTDEMIEKIKQGHLCPHCGSTHIVRG